MELRTIRKKILENTLKPLVMRRLRHESTFKRKGLEFKVFPGVFHPGLFYSTKVLLDFLDGRALKNKTLLEVGSGSGAIAVTAASNGALVTALDLNPLAVKNTQVNAESNQVNLKVLLSDLFTEIPKQIFDFIIINPPYYRGEPANEAELAWKCGPEFEYFDRLFSQLPGYYSNQSDVLMILSEDCEIERIKEIAGKYHQQLQLILKKRIWFELNYVFSISNL